MALNRPYLKTASPPRMNPWQYQIYYYHPNNPNCRAHATTRWSGLPLKPWEIIQPGERQISMHQYYEMHYGANYWQYPVRDSTLWNSTNLINIKISPSSSIF